MSRELEGYRDHLAALLEFTGGAHCMTVAEVARYAGKDPRTVKKRYDIQKNLITVEALARKMCQ